MATVNFVINGQAQQLSVDPKEKLLWVLREQLGLTGTKYGCGMAQCGTCTVLVNGRATRSCVTPVSAVAGKRVVTIEGLSPDGSHPLQQAWLAEDVPQCGYCQPGQIISAVALLTQKPHPDDSDIDTALHGNLCRCGTYPRIRRAVHLAAKMGGGK